LISFGLYQYHLYARFKGLGFQSLWQIVYSILETIFENDQKHFLGQLCRPVICHPYAKQRTHIIKNSYVTNAQWRLGVYANPITIIITITV
jgi:hypothetical protein